MHHISASALAIGIVVKDDILLRSIRDGQFTSMSSNLPRRLTRLRAAFAAVTNTPRLRFPSTAVETGSPVRSYSGTLTNSAALGR